jgi:SAM-dependent methyltransferase
MDRNLLGVAGAALDLAKPMPGERVLDIGCGSGETTLLLGEAVGPTGKVMGVDISHPLLTVARARGEGRRQWRKGALSRAVLPHHLTPFDAHGQPRDRRFPIPINVIERNGD